MIDCFVVQITSVYTIICIYRNQVVCRELDIAIFTENNFYN